MGISARAGPSQPPRAQRSISSDPLQARGRAASRGLEPSEWPQEGGQQSGPCSLVVSRGRAAHLRHLITVETQGEAGTVVVQMAGARLAWGAGQHGLLCTTRPPGRAGWLQTLATQRVPRNHDGPGRCVGRGNLQLGQSSRAWEIASPTPLEAALGRQP